ncbi:Uncharacterized protein APZ42_016597 [Daphnia magna]|uniref:Uncharacterized protein n=1 Tax=Daphnia magna TaxID=35525 RepID=A0A165AI02_9CRUS|nr:Uncharacterized protein APZ42_016597 [Daphnia magna]
MHFIFFKDFFFPSSRPTQPLRAVDSLFSFSFACCCCCCCCYIATTTTPTTTSVGLSSDVLCIENSAGRNDGDLTK